MTIVASIWLVVPLNTSPSTLPEMPETVVLSAYCQTFQVGHGVVALGAPVCGFGLAGHSAIHGIQLVTVVFNQVLAKEREV